MSDSTALLGKMLMMQWVAYDPIGNFVAKKPFSLYFNEPLAEGSDKEAQTAIICSETRLIDRTIPDFALKLGESATQSLSFEDSISKSFQEPGRCGNLTYTWINQKPTFTKISQGILEIQTTSKDSIGTYQLSLRV